MLKRCHIEYSAPLLKHNRTWMSYTTKMEQACSYSLFYNILMRIVAALLRTVSEERTKEPNSDADINQLSNFEVVMF